MSTAKVRSILDGVAALAMLLAAIAIIAGRLGSDASRPVAALPIPAEPVSIVDAHSLGRSDSPAALLIYSDFNCRYCRQFAQQSMPLVNSEYVSTGKVLIVFRHMAAGVTPPALAAECAADQGKFWPMHDSLFATPLEGPPSDFSRAVIDLELDRIAFETCMSEGATSAKVALIRRHTQEGRTLGVAGTPTIYVGRNEGGKAVRISAAIAGAEPWPRFKAVIDAVLDAR